MTSLIHFKFKSSKADYDTVVFDGAFISLNDLKGEIVRKKQMEKATDFDLIIINAQTNEAYKEDQTLIPKNTSVIVKRIPSLRPMNFAKPGPSDLPPPTQRTPVVTTLLSASGKEEDRIAEFVNAQSAWGGPDYNAGPGGRRTYGARYNDSRAPPPNYVCHRCGKPGHFISNCPTNGDPAYDKQKARAPIGIPKAFLKPVEDPESLGGGALLMPGGGFAVMMQGNSAEFNKLQSAVEAGSSGGAAGVVPNEMECPLCHELLNDAVMSPCCGTNFCDQCLRRAMLKSPNLVCPRCNKPNESLDNLTPNMKMRQKISQYKEGGPPTDEGNDGPPPGGPQRGGRGGRGHQGGGDRRGGNGGQRGYDQRRGGPPDQGGPPRGDNRGRDYTQRNDNRYDDRREDRKRGWEHDERGRPP
eukprot:CAMPEP_0114628906 /NCGR_PEP_ID=MMETSP0168-20121206/13074_1 /TAXON_ID=95228 ORGANISM="Vannella sp., Strain DIVA3 517/6/12" /NCGR_SAMPLE_ID=MMETSP0168 /ASSEMBLY_ACC=CAM_ASM_000044 /LENGTH=412 /DNA_ID=CAMNT_0001840327 /DNA_START=118 /DNA_END=1352 /DNA_ORIENTATION=-